MVLHFQKKLGLKLTGDVIHEKQVDYNNKRLVQQMMIKKDFVIDKQQETAVQ